MTMDHESIDPGSMMKETFISQYTVTLYHMKQNCKQVVSKILLYFQCDQFY